jgi:hypothetical protein
LEKVRKPKAAANNHSSGWFIATADFRRYVSKIMTKKYKKKVCVYCSGALSTAGEHIFAKEFFLKNQRANLPKAPSCDKCNRDKSRLENYLTTVLPFAGRHADALENLTKMVPGRLAENKKVHRRLASQMKKVWILRDSGLYAKQTTFKFEGQALIQLFKYIVRGIFWHHCDQILSRNTIVEVLALTKYGKEYFNKHFFSVDEFDSYSGNYGSGTISYKGVRDPSNPEFTCWVFSLYGGIQMYEDSASKGEISDEIGAITFPENLALQPKYGLIEES